MKSINAAKEMLERYINIVFDSLLIDDFAVAHNSVIERCISIQYFPIRWKYEQVKLARYIKEVNVSLVTLN